MLGMLAGGWIRTAGSLFYLVVLNAELIRLILRGYAFDDLPWLRILSLSVLPLRSPELLLFALPFVLGVRRAIGTPAGIQAPALSFVTTAFLSAAVTWTISLEAVPWQTHPTLLILLVAPATWFATHAVKTRLKRRSE